jgi:serine protease AprX
MTQIDRLHILGLNGGGITIGIIDTGVEIDYFDRSTLIAWHDCINSIQTPYDEDGHGTHIAGILFARESWLGALSGYNLRGICPNAKAIVVKAISKAGECSDENLARALDFCREHGADIVLISLGRNLELGRQSYRACVKAIDDGIIVVAPAGDDGRADDGDIDIFSNVSEIISVGSIRRDGYVSTFSSRGNQAWVPGEHDERKDPNKKPEVVAPGEDIISIYPGGYLSLSGTSQAAAYVAGTIALLLEAYPNLERNKNTTIFIKEILAETAKKVRGVYKGDRLSHNDRYGYGLVQAYDAYVKLSGG